MAETPVAKNNRKPVATTELINLAASVPPEFGADFLLSSIQQKMPVGDAAAEQKLIEYSFELASRAQEPMRRRALRGSAVDTRVGYRSSGYQLGLDRLSLQTRAIELMLGRNPAKAVELASEIRLPELPPLNCSDALAYDLEFVYKSLGSLVQQGFTAAQRRRERHLDFIRPYLAVTTPAQIASAIGLLIQIDPPDARFAELLGTIAAGIVAAPTDVRASDYVSEATQQAIASMVQVCTRRHLDSTALLAAYRLYLIASLEAPRCSDAFSTSEKEKPPAVVQFFNTKLAPAPPSDIAAITPDEVKHVGTLPGAAVYAFWQSEASSAILQGLKRLRFGGRHGEVSNEQKQSVEWQDDFGTLLSRIVDWTPSKGDDSMDFYQQKAAAFQGMVDLAPPGRPRQMALDSFCSFVRFGWDPTRRLEWFLPISRLLKTVDVTKDGQNEPVWRALSSCGDPILSLYTYWNRLRG